MKLKKLMKPCAESFKVNNGLHMDQSIYNIPITLIENLDPIIDVFDHDKNKIGTIKKDILINVNRFHALKLFTNILETLEEGIFVIDDIGIIIFANEQYSKMLNVPLEKIIGRHIQKVEPGAAIISVLSSKKITLLERQHIKSIDKYVTGKILPIYEGSKFIGAVSIFIDSTEVEILKREMDVTKQKVNELENLIQSNSIIEKHGIIGKNPIFLNTFYKALIASKTDVPILIKGENGVGKDILAKYIHENSKRSHKPLIIVNCAAIPETLIESELFGYEAGSFTGANKEGSIGKFELANGGTLFLDEIGDMPLSMQSKLLRAIQDNEIEKIGRTDNIKVDVRIIAATNQPLETMIKEKKFRRDLFYRINLVTLEIPPLRKRKDDIILFTKHFLNKYNNKYGKNVIISKEITDLFHTEKWPGNIREFKNCIEYGVIMSTNNIFTYIGSNSHVSTDDENYYLNNNFVSIENLSLQEQLEITEKRIIINALSKTNNNKTKAMELLNISRRTFYRKLNKYGIS